MIEKVEGDVNTSEIREEWNRSLSNNVVELLAEDEKYFIRQSLSTPCLDVLSSVEDIYLVNTNKKKYMDFHGNSVHQVGYNNPYVVKAVMDQMGKLSFSPRRYMNEPAIKLAKKLCSYFEEPYKVLFTPSGSSSISVALKMARLYTGKHKTISLWNSFHGANLDAISVGGEGLFRNNVGPLLPESEHIMPYNSYRCMFGDCKECGLKCLDYLEYIIESEGDIGAIIMETIRCTDVHIPPKEYFTRLREICTNNAILLILDEIPIGLGRTGKMFGFMNYDIYPDILVLGKGLGRSLVPMSAVVARKELDIFPNIALGHYTHEKNPIGSVAALATIEFIEKNNLLENVCLLGEYFKESILKLQNKYDIIGDVRSIGLLTAVELVRNRTTKEKAISEAEKILYHCLKMGLSFKISQGNILTLSPPLTINREQLDEALEIIEQGLMEVSE